MLSFVIAAPTAPTITPCAGAPWPPPAECSVSPITDLLAARDLQQISTIYLDSGTYALAQLEEDGFNLWRSVALKASPGAAAGSVIIDRSPDGLDDGRVMMVSPSVNVWLAGLTLSGGFARSENGGGILNRGHLTLKDCLITGSHAFGAPPTGGGGGLNNYEASASLINTIITNNTAQYCGGGVWNDDGDKPAGTAFVKLDATSKVHGNTAPSDPDIHPPP